MNLIKGKPPVYDKIIQAGLKPRHNTVFTYGEDLYIQDIDENLIDDLLLSHEEVHTRQQGDDVEGWWDKYLSDKQFRYEQELEAYGIQYKALIDSGAKDRAKKWFLYMFASDLASPMYGELISINEAESKIRNRAKNE